MNKGFSIEIQLDLSEEEKKMAEDFANKFIVGTIKHNMNYSKHMNTRAGYSSYLRRGVLGLRIERGCDLFFRRISKRLRRFAIVKMNTMQEKGTGTDLNDVTAKCMCPKHHGGVEIEWRYNPETYTYATVGDIKG